MQLMNVRGEYMNLLNADIISENGSEIHMLIRGDIPEVCAFLEIRVVEIGFGEHEEQTIKVYRYYVQHSPRVGGGGMHSLAEGQILVTFYKSRSVSDE